MVENKVTGSADHDEVGGPDGFAVETDCFMELL